MLDLVLNLGTKYFVSTKFSIWYYFYKKGVESVDVYNYTPATAMRMAHAHGTRVHLSPAYKRQSRNATRGGLAGGFDAALQVRCEKSVRTGNAYIMFATRRTRDEHKR